MEKNTKFKFGGSIKYTG